MTEFETDSHQNPGAPLSYGLVLLAGVFWSFGGLIVRQIQVANEWQIVFYRSMALVTTLLAFLVARHRGALVKTFRVIGTTGVVGGLCLAVAFVSFIFSLTHTTVANTLFLLTSAPFMAAVLGRLVLGEQVRRATWVAMIGAVLGIFVMVGEGIAGRGLFGDLMALAAAFGFAGFTVALRRGKAVEMLPAVCLAGIFGLIFTGLLAIPSRHGLAIPARDLLFSVLYGGAVGCGLKMYTTGSRQVPSAELTLLSLTEVVLGPVWVWLAIREAPSPMTIVGGVILLASITGLALHGMWRRPLPIGIT